MVNVSAIKLYSGIAIGVWPALKYTELGGELHYHYITPEKYSLKLDILLGILHYFKKN